MPLASAASSSGQSFKRRRVEDTYHVYTSVALPTTANEASCVLEKVPQVSSVEVFSAGSTVGKGKKRERWTTEEHNLFLEALETHGRAWERIQAHVGTKSIVQVRTHGYYHFAKQQKD